MLAQRAAQQSLRRLAASQPSMLSQMVFRNTMAPLAVSSSVLARRPTSTSTIQTQKLTPADSYEILVAQRKNRPNSPHLQIYKWQITAVMSIMNRFTGSVLSAGFYVFGLSYLVSPLLGWSLDSASMAAAFAAWPVALKVLAKFAVAMPFTFHSFNGVRHLVWDMGKQFTNQQVIRTGLFTTGIATVSALALALFV
ncbi:related to cytochrome b-large subunit [Phialocephala subalpina]|uniref:Related to cytochrome b-large subunit n=1 Tax=Phialocephala subalpina TaxID=576137 RepID=A0A1L7WUG1_9HELO|nr:related to cytochrome b-large subunit [Phialocephala subalpina]